MTIFPTKFSEQRRTFQVCQGLNSHYFHIIGDGHQPNSRVYIPIIRIPINGGMTIPNIATFEHGTGGGGNRTNQQNLQELERKRREEWQRHEVQMLLG